MKRVSPVFCSLLFIGAAQLRAEPWPSWRGDVQGSGRSLESKIPRQWGRDQNVKWRVGLPDAGNSTPVVFGDRVFITQAEEKGKSRSTMCFDRNTGDLLWKQGVTYDRPERTHPANPYCSASPTTDGEVIVVSYGSAGIAAYHLDGRRMWKRDLGAMNHVWGNSSSPLLYQNLCIHYHGPGKGGFLIALDKMTGETVWKYDEPEWKPGLRTDGFRGRDREGVIGSFSTPIVVRAEGASRDELVMSFPMEIQAFDPLTGKKMWSCKGLNPLVYSSPIYHDGIVLSMGGYHGNSLGVKAGGSGDVTGDRRIWYLERHNGGIGTGVVRDGLYYYPDSGGNIVCLEMKTGKTRWNERLPGSGRSWGSLLLAGDLIYALSQAGDTVVFKANPERLEVVADNRLGEKTNSSLAVSDGEIFIRTYDALWCISKDR